MKIEIWSIGKESDPHILEGVAFYQKRITPYCPIEMIVLSAPKRQAHTSVEQAKAMEEKLLLSKLTPQHYLILLDERGKTYTSLEWANNLQQLMNQGIKTLVILIGGPWGVSPAIKSMAKQTWSLSKLTFPHQLVRLIVAEQVYRSFSILHNSPYHHE